MTWKLLQYQPHFRGIILRESPTELVNVVIAIKINQTKKIKILFDLRYILLFFLTTLSYC